MEPSHYNLTARVPLPYNLTVRVPLPYDYDLYPPTLAALPVIVPVQLPLAWMTCPALPVPAELPLAQEGHLCRLLSLTVVTLLYQCLQPLPASRGLMLLHQCIVVDCSRFPKLPSPSCAGKGLQRVRCGC